MSLASWKEEFYPVSASETPKENAELHSLQKWIGLRKENLEKHGLRRISSLLVQVDNPEFDFSVTASTCALCKHYIANECAKCPLRNYLEKPCDSDPEYCEGEDEEATTPYFVWATTGDPEPMIAALKYIANVD